MDFQYFDNLANLGLTFLETYGKVHLFFNVKLHNFCIPASANKSIFPFETSKCCLALKHTMYIEEWKMQKVLEQSPDTTPESGDLCSIKLKIAQFDHKCPGFGEVPGVYSNIFFSFFFIQFDILREFLAERKL